MKEENLGCLGQFLSHYQINWQKYKLAEQTTGKQCQGRKSEETVHSRTITKVNSVFTELCVLAIDKMAASFRTALHSSYQWTILLTNSIHIVHFHV